MKRFAILAVISVLGCSTQEPKTQITNYETQGNLQTESTLACVPLSKVTNQHTPADIYPGVAACIKSGDYEKAAPLYGLAGTYGRFDQLRVTDETARQAIQVLQINNFGDITETQQENFKKTMLASLETGSPSFTSMCDAVKQIGPPKYVPIYMIQHGMNAFHGTTGSGLNPNFDPSKGWQDSLTGYLHCP